MSHAADPAAKLTAELEVKLLERLVAEWEAINYTFFKDVLRKPVFRLSPTRERLGQWNAELRSLELSRALVLERPWVEVIEVLKHEVAHQFVSECLRVDETAHGPTFRGVCERLGIDARATGSASTPLPDDDPAARAVDRIRKLLALAQSPNQHEAEAAATAARRLMLKLNLDLERDFERNANPAASPTTQRRHYGFRHLGHPSGRILEHERRLANILTRYFFVECLWIPVYRPLEGKRGTVLEICGRQANLVMAEHVHAFLSATAIRLWADYAQHSGRSSNRDRQAFLAGVMRGFETKLAAQNEQLQEQGLVWVPTAELQRFFRRRHPRIQAVRRGGAQRNAAFAEGHRAGAEIVLSRPVESGPSEKRPKALRAASKDPR
ncbi:SprT-like domain-containing protein [Paraliomyxa miuraensis]|uniref:SprT-like domain-containing protein n=1 Tax=Paraliomyxa miuraensis TaxID=376150 RepID=UPI002252B1D0|nr:SprT-like domain-containing protein [Paraliomyxa miuraensis]MCX4242306.1 SprT-like domain-containing protein [Paraliomyxa miuraensis]